MSLTSIFNCLAINRAGNNNLAAAKTTAWFFSFHSSFIFEYSFWSYFWLFGRLKTTTWQKPQLDSFLPFFLIKRRPELTKLISSLNFRAKKLQFCFCFVASARCFGSLSRFGWNQPQLISKANPAVFLNAWMPKSQLDIKRHTNLFETLNKANPAIPKVT